MKTHPSKLKGLLGTLFIFSCLFTASHAHATTISPVRFEISGDPGQTLQEEITIRNEQEDKQVYYPSYYNFEANGETGSPVFVQSSEGISSWMAGPSGVEVLPGDSKKITFVISIPANAEPGGYFGALLYGTTPPDQAGDQLAIGTQTGPLVLLRVNGEIQEKGAILDYMVKDGQKFFTSLPVTFMYRFQNSGNDRAKPEGTIKVRNIFGINVAVINANKVEGNILPHGIRKFEASWTKQDTDTSDKKVMPEGFWENATHEWHNFAIGYFRGVMNLSYGSTGQKASATVSFWVFPWQLLLIILVSILIVWFLVRTLLRRYNTWIIGKAEEAMIRHEKKSSEGPKHPRKTS